MSPRALLLASLLLLTLAPFTARAAADVCTPWLPAVDGRDMYCADTDSTVCPAYDQHDGRWLDYKLCLVPWPYGGPTPVLA